MKKNILLNKCAFYKVVILIFCAPMNYAYCNSNQYDVSLNDNWFIKSSEEVHADGNEIYSVKFNANKWYALKASSTVGRKENNKRMFFKVDIEEKPEL